MIAILQLLNTYWWALIVRGVAGILFGTIALGWPQLTVDVLVLLLGIYLLIDGIFAVISSLTRRRKVERRWVLTSEGLAGIAIGVLVLIWPEATALVLIYLIAVWAVLTGVMEILAAIRLRKEIEREWFLGLGGLLSVLLGVVLMVWPGPGLTALVWILGIYAIIFGAIFFIFGLSMRYARTLLDTHPQELTSGRLVRAGRPNRQD